MYTLHTKHTSTGTLWYCWLCQWWTRHFCTMYLAEAGVESISWTPVTQTILVAVCELTAHSTSPIITVAELKQNDVI